MSRRRSSSSFDSSLDPRYERSASRSRSLDGDGSIGFEGKRTRRRRDQRSQRRRWTALVALGFFGLLLLAAPSILCSMPYARGMAATQLESLGWELESADIQMGWITPLRVSDFKARGQAAGSAVSVDDIQTAWTLLDIWAGDPQAGRLKEITARGIRIETSASDEGLGIERDLRGLVADDAPSEIQPIGLASFQDMEVLITESDRGSVWKIEKSNAQANFQEDDIQVGFEAMLTEPGGSQGTLQGSASVPTEASSTPVQVAVAASNVPISWVNVLGRTGHLGAFATSVEGDFTGDVSFSVPMATVIGSPDPFSGPPSPPNQPTPELAINGATNTAPIEVGLKDVVIRNMVVRDAQMGQLVWQNELARVTGELSIAGGWLRARGLQGVTDFASFQMDGAVADSISLAGAASNPIAWMSQVDAVAVAELDLPSVQRALPNQLPLQRGVQLLQGKLEIRLEPAVSDRNNPAARRLSVQSNAIIAQTQAGRVRIAPVDAIARVSVGANRSTNPGGLVAEEFHVASPFARIDGSGDLFNGAANVNVDFGRLANVLKPIVAMDVTRLSGTVDGDVQWHVAGGRSWNLKGRGSASNLSLNLPGGRLQRDRLDAAVDVKATLASGRIANVVLDELAQADVRVTSNDLRCQLALVQPVRNVTRDQPLPIRLSSEGQLGALAQLARPWLPPSLAAVAGGYTVDAEGELSLNGRLLAREAAAEVNAFRLASTSATFEQDRIECTFDGIADPVSGDIAVNSMSVAGDAASAAIRGEYTNRRIDLQVAWQAVLERLQSSTKSRVAKSTRNQTAASRSRGASAARNPGTRSDAAVQSVAYRGTLPTQFANTQSWLMTGHAEGDATITGDDAIWHIVLRSTGTDVALIEPATAQSTSARRASAQHRQWLNERAHQAHPVWAESQLNVKGRLVLDRAKQEIATESLEVATDWFSSDLNGMVRWANQNIDLELRGPAAMNMSEVAKRVTSLAGMQVIAEGQHTTPMEILYAQNAKGESAFNVNGTLGWETVDTAGILFGPSEVPFSMNEDTIVINRSRVPILGQSRLTQRLIGPQVAPLDYGVSASTPAYNGTGSGELMLAGKVHYRPALWLELEPGPVARDVRLTPDMTGKWLKYLAPIAADAARIEGVFSAELNRAVVNLEQPEQSDVRGRLQLQGVRMNAGPLADQMIAGARQLQALVALGQNVRPPRTGRTLITMPAQNIEFAFANGSIEHRALMMDIDRARVITSGRVLTNGALDLIAQVPLDSSWLGSDLRGLAGQTMTLPIDGTLSRPSLDSSGIQRVMADLGGRAVQAATGNFLQEQIGRGSQQLNDSINRGIQKGFENLGIDRLLGR
ncbi:MAG: hypothetical protein AAGD07_18425 [Planctomycetota bacterium]